MDSIVAKLVESTYQTEKFVLHQKTKMSKVLFYQRCSAF